SGDDHVLARQGAGDVGDGDVTFNELVGVDPDPNAAIDVAAGRDLTDTFDRLELLLNLVARDVGQELSREGAANTDREERLIGGVAVGDSGLLDVLGRRSLRLGPFGLHVLPREIDVAPQGDFDGEARAAGARRAGDPLHALHLSERLFERLDD